MNLQRITKKELSQLTLAGVTIELDFVNDSPKTITFKDAVGGLVRVSVDSEYSSITVTVPQPPKMVDKWKLSGKVLGLTVDEVFDYEHEAKNRQDALNLSGNEADETEITKVSVAE